MVNSFLFWIHNLPIVASSAEGQEDKGMTLSPIAFVVRDNLNQVRLRIMMIFDIEEGMIEQLDHNWTGEFFLQMKI